MRIARVQIDSVATPVVALACDGALYDVAALEEERDGVASACTDFYTRVFTLGGAGLRQLDARLRSGDRPSAARILDDGALLLPACDPDRATLVHVAPAAGTSAPSLALDSPRLLYPVDLPLPVAAGARTVIVEAGMAVVLGEELETATEADAERAVFGYALHLRVLSRLRPLPVGQLGPAIVTPDEAAPREEHVLRLRVDGQIAGEGIVADPQAGLVAALAHASRVLPLHAGDVVSFAGIELRAEVPVGSLIELAERRLGTLGGRLFQPPG